MCVVVDGVATADAVGLVVCCTLVDVVVLEDNAARLKSFAAKQHAGAVQVKAYRMNTFPSVRLLSSQPLAVKPKLDKVVPCGHSTSNGVKAAMLWPSTRWQSVACSSVTNEHGEFKVMQVYAYLPVVPGCSAALRLNAAIAPPVPAPPLTLWLPSSASGVP